MELQVGGSRGLTYDFCKVLLNTEVVDIHINSFQGKTIIESLCNLMEIQNIKNVVLGRSFSLSYLGKSFRTKVQEKLSQRRHRELKTWKT